jgi:hypothetical protein
VAFAEPTRAAAVIAAEIGGKTMNANSAVTKAPSKTSGASTETITFQAVTDAARAKMMHAAATHHILNGIEPQ